MQLEKKVIKTIRENDLISKGDSILIAFSGGPDSVVLTKLLLKLKDHFNIGSLALAHLNHRLRSESFLDQQFSVEFGKKHGIPVFTKTVDISTLAKSLKKSTEDVARQERYLFFREIAKSEGFNKIATAHHLSDLVETLVLWFIQGSKRGLKGFRPKSEDIIRPLYNLTKDEILQYCKLNKLDYVIDRSNLSMKYLRNRVRWKVIPVMKEINTSLELSIERMSYFINIDESYFDKKLEELSGELDNNCLTLEFIKKLDDAILYRALHKWSQNNGLILSYQKLRQILEFIKKPEYKRSLTLSSFYILEFDKDKICLRSKKDMENGGFLYKLKVGDRLFIKEFGMWLEAFRVKKVDLENLKKDMFLECFDVKGDEFIVRSRKEGDRMIPFGQSSERKLKDIFIDLKVEKSLRSKIPILTFDDKILWVCGYKRSALFPVDKDSQNIVCFKLNKEV